MTSVSKARAAVAATVRGHFRIAGVQQTLFKAVFPKCQQLETVNFPRYVLVRHFSRTSWESTDDIDLDSVAYGFMASQALFTGLELGIFDKISAAGEKGLSADAIRQACGIDAPRTTTLLTALVAVKSLRRSGDGFYTLSPNTAQYMVSSSKHFYGDYLQYQIGRQFYHRMGALPDVMKTGIAPSYASWFSDPEVAQVYTQAQHNGSVATAKYLVKKKLQLGDVKDMLDVGGGSGAFSYVFTEATPGLQSTVLELPEVCRTAETIKARQNKDVQERVRFVQLDATSPDWPVSEAAFDIVLMSYISGSVPESLILSLYKNAFKALRPGGRLLVHDFMVNDSLDGPALGALWGLQHVTVNAQGLGLCPAEVIERMSKAGFTAGKFETMEMIHGMTKLIVAQKA
jgi:2-hydroxy-4-(methylsulfanyl)butanoate S-methyltransferase